MEFEEHSHQILLEERNHLTISGVLEVESFDDTSITMHTPLGLLIVQGERLHIEKLSLDGGDLKVEGMVESLTYEEDVPPVGGFFSRLLRG